jgi:TRAP-type C4-dicarboxylate transport system permease small subunit
MRALLHVLHKCAEAVMVALMAALFVAFIIQIASRYVFDAPVDWAYEVILDTWLWAVFWGCAFLLRDRDHVKFDVIYNMGGERRRRAFALAGALALAAGLIYSIPPTLDWISFKRIRSTDVLGIPFDYLFSVYMIFLVAVAAHYLLRIFRLLRGDPMATLEREEGP